MNLLFSCIGRRGYIAEYFREEMGGAGKIIGTSNTHLTPGFSACDRTYLVPDIDDAAYIPTLLKVCKQENVDALLSFFDLDVRKISDHLEDFRSIGVALLVPGPEASDVCFDKYRTSVFLGKNGFSSPATFITCQSAMESLNAGLLDFPVFVKPRYGFGSKNLFLAHNIQELETFFHYAPDMMIQAALPGDEYHLDILADLAGRVVRVIPKRKLAMRGGEVDQAEIYDMPFLREFGRKLGYVLGSMGHVGPLDVDLFLSDGELTVLELNPRFGGGYPFSHMAGADFPGQILKMLNGEPVKYADEKYESREIMMKSYSFDSYGHEALVSAPVNLRDA